MSASENQIVVHQPSETVRLDVRLKNETEWLTQAQLCDLFGGREVKCLIPSKEQLFLSMLTQVEVSFIRQVRC